MPNFLCTRALQLLQTSSDWESLDLRAILLDNTSTVGTQRDVATVSGYSTLGEVTSTKQIIKGKSWVDFTVRIG